MNEQEALLREMERCVVEMDEEGAAAGAERYAAAGYDAYRGIADGLSRGMERAGELFAQEEYFVPELLLCSDAMYAGLDVLRPQLAPGAEERPACAAIIGVVEGDTHDIGKNLVKIMLETAGFTVHDLGRNVSVQSFLEKAREVGSGLICLSTLMTTTMGAMDQVIRALEGAGIRDRFKVMVGGGPLSASYAERIGADAYTDNAAECAQIAKVLAQGLTA